MVRHKDVLLDRIGSIVDETIELEKDEEDWSEPKSILRQLLANQNLDRYDYLLDTRLNI